MSSPQQADARTKLLGAGMSARTLVWFRGKDLRVADHAPLRDAARAGDVLPLFVLDPYFFAPASARETPHRMQFLVDSLHELASTLEALGSRLLIARGRSVDVVPEMVRRWRVDRLVAHRWSEPFARERDRRVGAALSVPFDLYEGETLLAPGTLRNADGEPYRVFTPFARAFAAAAFIDRPIAAPRSLPPPDVTEPSEPLPTLESLGLSRNPAAAAGGERAGLALLRDFLSGRAASYDEQRDRLDRPGTSRLSAHLKFGTVSVRKVWVEIERALGATPAARAFRKELVWREFTHSTLWDHPRLLGEPFRRSFLGFPWREDDAGWEAWVHGRTGYPVVDAAARQLLGEGFVHNRARMIAASFLTKDLLIDYRRGEAHYLKYLTDGDWAQNNAGWQWSAGCGMDAQPYFRMFNPVTQGRRFDPEGAYVRRWVPELRALAAPHVHQPWAAPPAILAAAGVRIGEQYPEPIVDHAAARERFLGVARRHLKRRPRGTD